MKKNKHIKQLTMIATTTGLLLTGIFNINQNNVGAATVHTVKKGDTLFKLGQKYHVPYKNIKNWNHLSTDVIYMNQKLIVSNPSDENVIKTTTYKVTASALNVRVGSSTKYKSIGTVSKNQSLSVIKKERNGWYKINFKRKVGYVSGKYVKAIVTTIKPQPKPTVPVVKPTKPIQLTPKPPVEETVQSPVYNKTIVLDAGHGGTDPGAIGVNGVKEKDINLAIVMKLTSLLEKDGAVVLLTRTGDKYLPLADRSKFANDSNGNSYLSVHSNSSTSSTASGVETYYYNHTRSVLPSNAELTKKSKRLAQCIQDAMVDMLGAKDRGIDHGNFHVIRETKIPSALVEVGFVSNVNEAKKLSANEYQNMIGNALYEGFKRYFENENK